MRLKSVAIATDTIKTSNGMQFSVIGIGITGIAHQKLSPPGLLGLWGSSVDRVSGSSSPGKQTFHQAGVKTPFRWPQGTKLGQNFPKWDSETAPAEVAIATK